MFVFLIFLFACLFVWILAYSQCKREVAVLKRENVAVRDLIVSANYGFYIWNGENRTNEFSPNMQSIFKTVFCSFDEFASIFEESERLANEVRVAKSHLYSFSLDLKAKESDDYYKCCGKSSFGVGKKSNKIVCVMLWISNISNDKKKISDLEIENIKLRNNVSIVNSMINDIPLPLWKKEKDDTIYNSFYERFIKNFMPEFALSKKVDRYDIYTGEVSVVLDNRSRCYMLTENDHGDYVIGYGQDITRIKELEERMNSYLLTQKEFIDNLASPIAIYGRDQSIQGYNKSFLRMSKLSEKEINELSLFKCIFEHMISADIFYESNERMIGYMIEFTRLFSGIMEPYHNTIRMKDNTIYKMLVVPNSLGGLLFIYESLGSVSEK